MSLYSEMSVFVAVAEEQSFTKAAEKLAVTPTAISKQIKQLEARLQQQLLERSTRKVKITELGEQFYTHCKRVEQEIAGVEGFIQSQNTEPQGRLRILSSLFFAHSHLINNLQEFHERYPRIQLDIELAERIPDMEREDFDILMGFSLLPQIDPHLRQRKLIVTEYALCAAPHYLKKYGTPKTPQDLKKHKLINHPLRQPLNLIRFQNGTCIYMDPPEIIINNLEALMTVCCDGAGVLLSTKMHISELLKQKKLVHILPEYPISEVALHLFYRHSEYEQRKIRCFIDFLLEKI